MYRLIHRGWLHGFAAACGSAAALLSPATAAIAQPVFTDVTAAAGPVSQQHVAQVAPNCVFLPVLTVNCETDRLTGGVAVGDFDGDGWPDLYVTRLDGIPDMTVGVSDILFRNKGDGTFEDVTVAAGVAPGGWAWGAKFIDMNNDGFEDLYSPCGFVTGADTSDL